MYGKGTAREFIRFPIAAAVGHLVRVWDRLPDLVPVRHWKLAMVHCAYEDRLIVLRGRVATQPGLGQGFLKDS